MEFDIFDESHSMQRRPTLLIFFLGKFDFSLGIAFMEVHVDRSEAYPTA